MVRRRYYQTKYKKVKVPHVVAHYAAGARLIGLTDKQIAEHLENLKRVNARKQQRLPPEETFLYFYRISYFHFPVSLYVEY